MKYPSGRLGERRACPAAILALLVSLSRLPPSFAAIRSFSLTLTPTTTISGNRFACEPDVAVAIGDAAELCWIDSNCDATSTADASAIIISVGSSECDASATSLTNDQILIRGGVFQSSTTTDAEDAAVTDACIRSSLESTSCRSILRSLIPNLVSMAVTVDSDESVDDDYGESEGTSPTVEIDDDAILNTSPPTSAPALLIVVEPATLAPVAPTIQSVLTAAPSPAPPTTTNSPTRSSLVVPPPTSLSPTTATPLGSSSSSGSSTPSASPTHATTPQAPVTGLAPNSTNLTTSSGGGSNAANNNSNTAPLIQADNNNSAGGAGDNNNSGDSVVWKSILGAFGAVSVIAAIFAAAVWRRSRHGTVPAHRADGSAGASSAAFDQDGGNKKVLATSTVPAAHTQDTTHNMSSDHSMDDLDHLEEGGHTTNRELRDVTTTLTEHFGDTRYDARTRDDAQNSNAIPEQDELSSECSSFDLNDSDGEESSTYESEGEGDGSLTLEEGDFEMASDPVVGKKNRRRTSDQGSTTPSEVSSLSSVHYKDVGNVNNNNSAEEVEDGKPVASRQFLEWLQKSPLVPAAAKASRSSAMMAKGAQQEPQQQKQPLPTTVAMPMSPSRPGPKPTVNSKR